MEQQSRAVAEVQMHRLEVLLLLLPPAACCCRMTWTNAALHLAVQAAVEQLQKQLAESTTAAQVGHEG